MTFNRSAAAIAMTLAIVLPAHAIPPYFSTPEGAIRGYDPVAYFTEGKAVKGDRQLSVTWQNTEWRFASQANLTAFKADPEKYAPQFGGYCAFGVSQGYAPPVDPTAFTIVDGKLYLNYSHHVSAKWNADRDSYIVQGKQHWPGLKAGDKTSD
jgi:YHS domain-containing protein